MDQQPPSSNSLLAGLMILTIFVSIGGVAYTVKRQDASERAQRELILALSRAPSPAVTAPVPAPVPVPATTTIPSTGSGVMADPTFDMPAERSPQRAIGNGEVVAMNGGVTLFYPKGWTAALYEDEFFGGQMNLRLTSRPGQLDIDGNRQPGTTYFTQGYQVVFREIDKNQMLEIPTVPTQNPLVRRFDSECAGNGCTQAQFLVVKGGRRFLLDVYYSLSERDEVGAMMVVEDIVSSIR